MRNKRKSFQGNSLSGYSRVKYLAKKNEKLIDPQAQGKLTTLKKLINEQDRKCWEIGDLCIELIDEYGLSLAQIGGFTDYSRTRISHFHLTARTFTTNDRKGCTFQDSLTARQIYQRLPRLNMTPVEIRDIIVKLRNKTPVQVRGYFIKILMDRESNQHLAYSAQSYVNKDKLIDNCHHADWRTVVSDLPNEAVQLFIADPPFPTYGGYMSKRAETNALRRDCDNGMTEEQALEVTLPLFEFCLPKLAPEGILLLFQSGGKSDRIEVLQKAQECGWECLYGLTWNKGSLATGNFMNPYLICSERILVFCRKGIKPKKYQDGLPHSDVLHFSTETKHVSKRMHSGKVEYGDYHIFQKPSTLMEFLVKHHSFPGDLVVEPFGCSGSGVIAAAQLNRQWVYIESNEENYLWGSQRVFKAVSGSSVQAG